MLTVKMQQSKCWNFITIVQHVIFWDLKIKRIFSFNSQISKKYNNVSKSMLFFDLVQAATAI